MAEYNWIVIVLSIIVLIMLGWFVYSKYINPQEEQNVSSKDYLGKSSYYDYKIINGETVIHPYDSFTPGEVYTNDLNLICNHYYDILLTDLPKELEDQVYSEYNITTHTNKEYEIDHWIPVALGGSNNITNLWPQPRGYPGYREKDKVQLYLREQVCNNNMSLTQARQLSQDNWFEIYLNISQQRD